MYKYPIPLFLQYEVTYSCNSKCIFCYNLHRTNLHPPEDVSTAIAKSLLKYDIPHIQLTGGEVSIYPHLQEVVNILNSSESAISIVTNGIKKINEKTIETIHSVFFSLHGKERNHEYLTRMKGSYKKIISNLIYYYDILGSDVSIDFLLTSINYKDIYDVALLANDIGISQIFVNRFQPGGMGSKVVDLIPTPEMFKEALNLIIKAKNEFNINIMFGTSIPLCVDKRLLKYQFNPTCGAGTYMAVVDPYGNIKPCNQSHLILGNIIKNDLENIWKNNKYLQIFRSTDWLPDICKKCYYKSMCKGGCRVWYKKEPWVDYWIHTNQFNPSPIKTEVHPIKKEIYVDNNIKINKKQKIIFSHGYFFLVNSKVGVVELDANDVDIIKDVIDKNDISSLSINDLKKLISLGVLT